MWFVGLDVHFKRSTFHVLDENGKTIKSRTLMGGWKKLFGELKEIEKPFSICFEAGTGYGYLFEKLSRIATHVKVAHPGHLRLIFRSKRKNDRVDAEKLAKLLYLDEVPPVYVPSKDIRDWRSMIEHRHRIVNEGSRVKNQIKAFLKSNGIEHPKRLWAGPGKKWMKSIIFDSEVSALQMDILLERLEETTQMARRAEKVLERIAVKHTGVPLLRTIPGVGIRTAEAVVAYIDNPARFRNAKSVGSYFGLVPVQDASANVNRMGHITHEGPSTVRKLLVEASWQGIKKSPAIRDFYTRVKRDDPDRTKIAITATAHWLLRIMFSMLRTGELWRQSA